MKEILLRLYRILRANFWHWYYARKKREPLSVPFNFTAAAEQISGVNEVTLGMRPIKMLGDAQMMAAGAGVYNETTGNFNFTAAAEQAYTMRQRAISMPQYNKE